MADAQAQALATTAGITGVSYLIASNVDPGSALGQFFRGFMIGFNAGMNGVLAGAIFGPFVGLAIGLINPSVAFDAGTNSGLSRHPRLVQLADADVVGRDRARAGRLRLQRRGLPARRPGSDGSD